MPSFKYNGRILILILLVGLISPVAIGQFRFSDVSSFVGIGAFDSLGHGAGIAAADYDEDGDIDIFAPTTDGMANQLYRNNGDGTFEEIAAQVGLDSLQNSRAAIWFDYDGDHRLDLLVGGDCWAQPDGCNQLYLHLYRQLEDGTFADVTAAAGITEDIISSATVHRGGIAVGDINNDSYLDIAITVWEEGGRLLLNNTDGTFTDISAGSGLEEPDTTYWQHAMHDFNGDGWTDIFTTYDFGDDALWINQQDNTFSNLAPSAGVDNPWNGMGITLADYDNDLDIDIYISNITQFEKHNMLYRNDSVGSTLAFTEVSVDLGVDDGEFAWGCTFFDANNDGYLDLGVTNGFLLSGFTEDPSRFFLNDGGDFTSFSEVSDEVGFNDTFMGSSLIAFDYDRDGDMDMLQTTRRDHLSDDDAMLRLLQNNPDEGASPTNNLLVQPRLEGPNHWAIGAAVQVTSGDLSMMRLITAGISFMGQEPAEANFGLGTRDMIDTLRIEWPDGTTSVAENIPANETYTTINKVIVNKTGDSDYDQLPDLFELEIGTNHFEPDTDGDGVSDGLEVAYGTDPLDPEDMPAIPVGTPLQHFLLAISILTISCWRLGRVSSRPAGKPIA